MNRFRTGLLDFFKRWLEHRRLPIFLAIGAVLVMLPALKLGLIADDLPQRAVELRPDQLPPRMFETGNPADSGSFSTVLFDLFGCNRNSQCVAVMKNYGTLPWWTPADLRLSLCRPVAAFTHWMDYRLFPDSPALMHAHNIAWFAAVVFAVTMVYRKLMGTGWAAGLAALLFLCSMPTPIFRRRSSPTAAISWRCSSACCAFMNIINGVLQNPVPRCGCPCCSWPFRF
jgi:hypothetical protein